MKCTSEVFHPDWLHSSSCSMYSPWDLVLSMPYIFLDQFLSEAYMKQKQVFNYISMIINICYYKQRS